jgi:hypothetical protein
MVIVCIDPPTINLLIEYQSLFSRIQYTLMLCGVCMYNNLKVPLLLGIIY